jgi:hypothetical protein
VCAAQELPGGATTPGAAAAPLTEALVGELEALLAERQDVIRQLERYPEMTPGERRRAFEVAVLARLRHLAVRQEAVLTALDRLAPSAHDTVAPQRAA